MKYAFGLEKVWRSKDWKWEISGSNSLQSTLMAWYAVGQASEHSYKYLHCIVTDTAKIFHYGWYGYVLAVGTFVTIIERKYCEVLLMMTTDQRRMWMIYLTMAASLIMTDSANNGGGGAVCAQERDEIPSITCSRCRHNPIAAYTRHSVLH